MIFDFLFDLWDTDDGYVLYDETTLTADNDGC